MILQAKGSHFGPKHLEQTIPSYLHFIKTGQAKPSQAKPSQANIISNALWLHTGSESRGSLSEYIM